MSQTRCDAFGHSWSFWKEGGKCYMRCDYCSAVQPLSAANAAAALAEPEQHSVWDNTGEFPAFDTYHPLSADWLHKRSN